MAGSQVRTADAIKHRQIAEVWPEFGCVNLRRPPPYTGEIDDKWIVARCQEYLEALMKRRQLEKAELPTQIAGRYREFICY